MNKENASKLWKMIQEAGDYLQGQLPDHPNHPKGRNLDESMNKLLKLYESCGFKLIKGTKDFMVTDLWNYHS